MNVTEGQLRRLGESTVDMRRGTVKYALIQIGDHTLTDVRIDRKLNHFLCDGLRTQARTRLWMLDSGKVVMAVKVGGDARYYGALDPLFHVGTVLNVVFAGIVFTLHPLAGVVWAGATAALFGRKWLSYRRIAAVGGTRV